MNDVLEIQLLDILEESRFHISDISPSEWTEKKRFMTSEVSPFPGPFNYDRGPYFREIVNHVQRSSPAREITFMKGAQIGASTNVIESAIGYLISEDPCPILFFTGHIELTKKAMNGKIDQMIDSCGLRPYIRPNVLRKKNQRTGDTNLSKEFPGGSLHGASADNHGTIRQLSVKVEFNDDIEQARQFSTDDGDTVDLIRQRTAAFGDQKKIYWISTPKTKHGSVIEPLFLQGDQRYWHVPCPCCGVFIIWLWETPMKDNPNEKGGITWKLDAKNKLIPGSVGYTCQECGGFFDDKNKRELLLDGEWIPTATPSRPGFYSYHLSALYAGSGMDDWENYVSQYLEACPPGGAVNDAKLHTFTNLVLGQTYQPVGEAPKASELQKNQINYTIGTVPERISIRHGNGKIVLITCACDLNGTVDDARLDYEVVAWSESGSSYRITHGSIGTFVPREGEMKVKVDRERMSYQMNKPNSVWKKLAEVIQTKWEVDSGRSLKIFITGVDCGYHTDHAYSFIDSAAGLGLGLVFGLKGDKGKYIRFNQDLPKFKPAKERSKLFIVEVGRVKDELSEAVKLTYSERSDERQPAGFMNFPFSDKGQYQYKNYFEHWESEHRVIKAKEGQGVSAIWEKKNSSVMNHFWDVAVYSHTLKDIITSLVCKEAQIKNYSWNDYVDIMMQRFRK